MSAYDDALDLVTTFVAASFDDPEADIGEAEASLLVDIVDSGEDALYVFANGFGVACGLLCLLVDELAEAKGMTPRAVLSDFFVGVRA
jgi:hypothetical protein